MSQPGIIFAGSGEFGLPTLRALRESGFPLAMVCSQPDRPAGRGRKLSPTPIAQYALDQDLPLLRTDDINSAPLPPAELLVVIAFGQKIAAQVVDRGRLGGINLHASLLPKYRGAAPINWAILNGERVTGNSVIRLAQRMDAGAVLGQSQLEIGELETAGELHDRLAEDGAPLVLKVVRALADGSAVEIEQDHAQATLAPKLSRDAAKLDWQRPAGELANRIRGLYPWPGCRARVVSGDGIEARLTLVRGRPVAGGGVDPGTIDSAGHVVCGGGTALEVVELQPEGKRPMPLAAYRNGHPWQPGMRVESI